MKARFIIEPLHCSPDSMDQITVVMEDGGIGTARISYDDTYSKVIAEVYQNRVDMSTEGDLWESLENSKMYSKDFLYPNIRSRHLKWICEWLVFGLQWDLLDYEIVLCYPFEDKTPSCQSMVRAFLTNNS